MDATAVRKPPRRGLLAKRSVLKPLNLTPTCQPTANLSLTYRFCVCAATTREPPVNPQQWLPTKLENMEGREVGCLVGRYVEHL